MTETVMTETALTLEKALNRVRSAKIAQACAERNLEAAKAAEERAVRVTDDAKNAYGIATKETRAAIDALEDMPGEPATEAADPGAIPVRGYLGVDLASGSDETAYTLNGQPVQRDDRLQDFASAGAIEPDPTADHDAEGEGIDAEAEAAAAFGSIPARIAEASGS